MILNNIKKFIFPSRCVICDKVLPYGDELENEFLCNSCKDCLEFIKTPVCKKCGAMISREDGDYCVRCKREMHNNFDYGFSLLRYNDFVKDSLHRIKYGERKEYLYFYGKLIAKAFKNRFMNIAPDYFVPVPIHSERLRERNFNQAEILANVVSGELKNYGIDVPVDNNIVFRTKNTKVLNQLSREDRTSELEGAFSVNEVIDVDKVIIVDDIYTTGATIDEIAKVLKSTGVSNVYFVTIAIVDNL